MFIDTLALHKKDRSPRYQNRKRTGVPNRAARLGWWMRPGRH